MSVDTGHSDKAAGRKRRKVGHSIRKGVMLRGLDVVLMPKSHGGSTIQVLPNVLGCGGS